MFVLALLLAGSIMTAAAAVPTGTTVLREHGGRVTEEASSADPLAFLYVAFTLVLLATALTALAAYARRNVRLARRLLLVTAVLGIVPTVVPGLLALVTRVQINRVEDAGRR